MLRKGEGKDCTLMEEKGDYKTKQKFGLAVPCNPVTSLIVSKACRFPITPVTAPSMPDSSHDPIVSGAAGFG